MRKRKSGEIITYSEEGDELDLNHHQQRLRYLKTRRNFRRIKLIIARFRILFRLIAIFLIAFGLIKLTGSPQWYLKPDVFSYYPNDSLEIQGNEIVKVNQIMAKLRTIKLPREQIYLLDTQPIEKALQQLVPIEKAHVRRFWFPARLKIVIDERLPVLSIAPSPNAMPIAVFTDDSFIIDREFLPLNPSKKTYLIITYSDFYKWTSKQLNYLIYLSKLFENYSGQNLKYIDIRNPDDVYAQLDTVRIRVGELNATVFKRCKRISSVLPQTSKLNGKIEYIDLRWDNSTFIKLKEKDISQESQNSQQIAENSRNKNEPDITKSDSQGIAGNSH